MTRKTTRLVYDPKTDSYRRVVGMALTYRERANLNSHPATRPDDGRHQNGRRLHPPRQDRAETVSRV